MDAALSCCAMCGRCCGRKSLEVGSAPRTKAFEVPQENVDPASREKEVKGGLERNDDVGGIPESGASKASSRATSPAQFDVSESSAPPSLAP